jgi:hypothetical protein
MRVWCVGSDGVNAWGHSRIGEQAGEGVRSGKKPLTTRLSEDAGGLYTVPAVAAGPSSQCRGSRTWEAWGVL